MKFSVSYTNLRKTISTLLLLFWRHLTSLIFLISCYTIVVASDVTDNGGLYKDPFLETCFEVPTTLCLTTESVITPNKFSEDLAAYWYVIYYTFICQILIID